MEIDPADKTESLKQTLDKLLSDKRAFEKTILTAHKRLNDRFEILHLEAKIVEVQRFIFEPPMIPIQYGDKSIIGSTNVSNPYSVKVVSYTPTEIHFFITKEMQMINFIEMNSIKMWFRALCIDNNWTSTDTPIVVDGNYLKFQIDDGPLLVKFKMPHKNDEDELK